MISNEAPWDAWLRGSAALYAEFADAAAAFASAGGPPDEAARRRFEAFGARAFASLVPPFAAFGAPAPSSGAPAAPASPGDGPALGPFREHQVRAQALAAALAELTVAQQRLASLLTEAGLRAARAFVDAGPTLDGGPRQLFDRWIDLAEAEWQTLAHGEAWCAAQARAFDAALEVRARQQAIADDAARLAGLPTRAEVDDLQRRVRDLERGRRG